MREILPDAPAGSDQVTYTLPCSTCKDQLKMTVHTDDYRAWKGGRNPSLVFPYLSTDHHDRLITGECSACLAKTVGRMRAS